MAVATDFACQYEHPIMKSFLILLIVAAGFGAIVFIGNKTIDDQDKVIADLSSRIDTWATESEQSRSEILRLKQKVQQLESTLGQKPNAPSPAPYAPNAPGTAPYTPGPVPPPQ